MCSLSPIGRASVAVNADTTVCSNSVKLDNPVYRDNCGVSSLRLSLTGATVASFPLTGINTVGTYTFNKGITTILYSVRDSSGNFSSCSSTFTVLDKTIPVVTNSALRDTIKATLTSGCVATITIPNPLPWDACSQKFTYKWSITGATTGMGVGLVGSYNFNIGISTINDTLFDEAGNKKIFKMIVSVKELINPTITCPANETLTTTTCPKAVTVVRPTFGDNCKVNYLRWTISGATSATSPLTGINHVGTFNFKTGNNAIVYKVSDVSGNIVTCKQQINITGTVCPSFAKEALLVFEEETLKYNLLSNPARQQFSLRLQSENSQPIEVIVYAQNGRKVDQFKARNTQVLNFGERYNTGSYHIIIRQGTIQKSITALKM